MSIFQNTYLEKVCALTSYRRPEPIQIDHKTPSPITLSVIDDRATSSYRPRLAPGTRKCKRKHAAEEAAEARGKAGLPSLTELLCTTAFRGLAFLVHI